LANIRVRTAVGDVGTMAAVMANDELLAPYPIIFLD